MQISELAAAMCRGSVKIRGREFPARAVSAAELTRIQRVKHRPGPPPMPSSHRTPDGPEFNEGDPTYRQADEEWARWFKCVELAVATDAECAAGRYVQGMDPAAFAKWANAAAAELSDALTMDEINRAWLDLRKLTDPDKLEADARKNSSPQCQPQAADTGNCQAATP